MGHYTKAPGAKPLKRPEDLLPGEWTIVNPEPADRAAHNLEYYVRLLEGEKTLAYGNWEEPVRGSGVEIAAACNPKTCDGRRGSSMDCTEAHCGHLVFKNIIAMHVWNDGFNIHGNVRDLHFENIAAIECGDDGISAHEAVSMDVKNYVSIRNSTGICHIKKAATRHENVFVEGRLGVDFFPCDSTVTILTDALFFYKFEVNQHWRFPSLNFQ